jgi:tRNA(fMet)-specific endonuclease VapC
MRFLLDTNACVDYLRRKSPAVVKRIEASSPEDLCTSSIVEAELRYGAENSADAARNHGLVDALLAELQALEFDRAAASIYGRIRKGLEAKGTPIGPHDLLIAAHALSLDATLVTSDTSEFSRVPGLQVEDWRRP